MNEKELIARVSVLHGEHVERVADLVAEREELRAERLQQLREEFEAARAAYLSCFDLSSEVLGDANYISSWCDDLISPEFYEKVRMVDAARRYIAARDYSVFDDRWDMVWKLQNGGQL